MDKKIILSSLACSLVLGAGALQAEEEVLHYTPLGAATEVRADLVAKKAYADDDSDEDMTDQQKKKKNKDKEGDCKKKGGNGKDKEGDCKKKGGNGKDKEGKCKQGSCG